MIKNNKIKIISLLLLSFCLSTQPMENTQPKKQGWSEWLWGKPVCPPQPINKIELNSEIVPNGSETSIGIPAFKLLGAGFCIWMNLWLIKNVNLSNRFLLDDWANINFFNIGRNSTLEVMRIRIFSTTMKFISTDEQLYIVDASRFMRVFLASIKLLGFIGGSYLLKNAIVDFKNYFKQ